MFVGYVCWKYSAVFHQIWLAAKLKWWLVYVAPGRSFKWATKSPSSRRQAHLFGGKIFPHFVQRYEAQADVDRVSPADEPWGRVGETLSEELLAARLKSLMVKTPCELSWTEPRTSCVSKP